MKAFTFSRSEHLKNKKTIDLLFSHGRSIKSYPVRFQFIVKDQKASSTFINNMEVAFVVPKRNFRKAVDRNQIKRQLHESFRLNRADLSVALKENDKILSMMVIFVGNKFLDYDRLDRNVQKAITDLISKQLNNAVS